MPSSSPLLPNGEYGLQRSPMRRDHSSNAPRANTAHMLRRLIFTTCCTCLTMLLYDWFDFRLIFLTAHGRMRISKLLLRLPSSLLPSDAFNPLLYYRLIALATAHSGLRLPATLYFQHTVLLLPLTSFRNCSDLVHELLSWLERQGS